MFKTSVQTLVKVAAVVLFGILSVVSAGIGDGGSRCADASCTPAPGGAQCEPRYERDDNCCPVWYCTNGQTAYGMTRGHSYSSGSGNSYSYSSSSSSGDPGIGNMFGNLFANLLGG